MLLHNREINKKLAPASSTKTAKEALAKSRESQRGAKTLMRATRERCLLYERLNFKCFRSFNGLRMLSTPSTRPNKNTYSKITTFMVFR